MYLISPENRYVEKMLWMYDLIIALTIMFFVPSLVFLVLRLKNSRNRSYMRRSHLSLLLTGVFSIFMMSLASSFLWKQVSILPKLQFPWRWLLVATVTGPICAALVYARVTKDLTRRTILYPVLALILGLCLFAITQNIIPSVPLERSVFDKQVSEMDTTEACACWWPIWAKQAQPQSENVDAGSRTVSQNRWSAAERVFAVDSGQPGSAVVATFWYPYWKATVNGSSVEVVPTESGLINIPLPAEVSDVHLYFKEPWFIGAAEYVSLFTWSVLVVMFLFAWRNRRTKLEPV